MCYCKVMQCRIRCPLRIKIYITCSSRRRECCRISYSCKCSAVNISGIVFFITVIIGICIPTVKYITVLCRCRYWSQGCSRCRCRYCSRSRSRRNGILFHICYSIATLCIKMIANYIFLKVHCNIYRVGAHSTYNISVRIT